MTRTIRRILAITLILVMAMSLVACGNTNGGTENKDDGETKAVLKVGMECNYAPYNWSQKTDADGAVKISNVADMYANGYDVQVAKNIADSLGMELEIYAYEWDSLVPAVQAGTLDLIIAGMSPTAERRAKVDFSEPYWNSNLVVITRKDGNLTSATTLADLDGKKIAAQSGTSHLTALESQTKADIQEMSDFTTMLLALSAKTIDGYVAEEPTAMSYCTESSDYTYIPFKNNETGFTVPVDDTSIAVGVKKGSDLLAKVNAYIATFTTEQQTELLQKMVSLAPQED